MMDSLLLAVQFLTAVPLKIKEFSKEKMAWAIVYFPVVGLLLGLLLSGINTLLRFLSFPIITVNIILTVALIMMTGGLHLDGLADTADAFFSGKSKEEMLAIMRDPHVGVMGVLSLITVMLLKVGLLCSLGTTLKTNALLLMCVLSRWSVVLATFFFPYARNNGKAKLFIEGMNLKIFLFSTISALLFTFAIWKIRGTVILLIIAGFTYLIDKIISRKIMGITGDTLGAAIELTEIITLFAVRII